MTEPQYRTVKPQSLWSAAAEQIRTMIESGEIPEGARLPAERELCVRLGISRISLRESLRVLQSTGYVETRPGSGTYARLPEPVDGGDLEAWIARDLHIQELFELRRAVEPGVAALAAAHHLPELLDRMQDAVDELREGAEGGGQAQTVAADAEFHRLIGYSIDNPAITKLTDQMFAEGGAERRLSLSVPGQAARAAEDHQRILDAIRAGDEAGARDAMLNHLVAAVEWITDYSHHPTNQEEP